MAGKIHYATTGAYPSRYSRMVRYVCKHCKVDVISKTDLRPVLGKEHKPNCPRKRMMG